MDLIQQQAEQINLVSNVSELQVQFGESNYSESVIVTADAIVANLSLNSVSALSKNHIDKLLESNPQVIIFGCGKQHVFPDTSLLSEIAQREIGFEVMVNQAAARTYNVMVAEGRKVACLLILDSEKS